MRFTPEERARFGRVLRTARIERGAPSVRVMANEMVEAGIDTYQQRLDNWERGRNVPERFETIEALEAFYGIEGWLLAALNVPNSKPQRERRHLRAAFDGDDPGETPKGRSAGPGGRG